MAVTDVRARAQEILPRVSPDMFRDAYKRGMTFSAWLETQDPSQGYNDGLDSFGRLLQVAEIRTNTMEAHGVWADKFEKFDANEQTRALAVEWFARQWRTAQLGRRFNTRGLYQASDDVAGGVGNPISYANQVRAASVVGAAIPVSELVALTTPVDSGTYEAYYLTPVAAEERMLRVPEATDIPLSKLVGAEHPIKLKKYGRGLEQSYEQIRRTPIDKVAYWIQIMAAQTENDKVAAIIDILVNGDGNANTAATSYNLTTLDSGATAGTITLKAWLALKMKLANPLIATTVLCQEAMALQLQLLNLGSANVPLVFAPSLGGFRNINSTGDMVALGWTSDAPANKLVLFDNRMAIERVFEIAGNITEIERYVRRQTQAIYVTEVEGFCVFQPGAAKVMNVAA